MIYKNIFTDRPCKFTIIWLSEFFLQRQNEAALREKQISLEQPKICRKVTQCFEGLFFFKF